MLTSVHHAAAGRSQPPGRDRTEVQRCLMRPLGHGCQAGPRHHGGQCELAYRASASCWPRPYTSAKVTTTISAVRPAADAARLWLWHDALLVHGALVFTSDRAAAFLALEEQFAALHAWAVELDRILPASRPGTA